MILILFLKLQKKKYSKREKRARVLARENFSKNVSFFERFLTFCQIGKITFSAIHFSWLSKSGGFLILFS